MIGFLRWFFLPSGIVCVEESGKLGWFEALRRLFSGGVARKPKGPTDFDLMGYAKMGLRIKRYRCSVCGVHFWAWRKRAVCNKFSCYRRRNEVRT